MTDDDTPEVGRPLPRAEKAWVADAKWDGYVLAEDGHGADWHSVFHVDESQSAALWRAFVELANVTPITNVRESPHGVGCEMHADLTFNDRTAPVILVFF